MRLSRSARIAIHAEAGAAMVEYALLVALIAVVCLLAVAVLGTSLNHSLSHSASAVAPPG